jgi:HEPN domain-containing protein
MAERSSDWLEQAKRDFAAAEKEARNDFFEWACFIYQQAAEKAIKAVYQKLSGEVWGHSVFSLLKGLSDKLKIEDALLESGKQLDKFYISARYPNGWVEGFPGQMITKKEAEDARDCAEKIMRFCEDFLVK